VPAVELWLGAAEVETTVVEATVEVDATVVEVRVVVETVELLAAMVEEELLVEPEQVKTEGPGTM